MLLTDRAARRIKSDSELLSIELLEEHARRLAALLSLSPRRRGSAARTCASSRSTCGPCARSTRALAEDARQRADVARRRVAARQLPHHLGRGARHPSRSAARRSSGGCRAIAADEFAGLPRIYALALELIGSSAGRLDAQRLQRFITAFQSVTPLTIGELWAWPSALKLALLEHLRARARRARGDPRASARRRSRWPRPLETASPAVRRLAGGGPSRRSSPGCCSARASSARSRRRAAARARRGAGGARRRRSRTRSAPRASTRRREQASMANLIGSLRLISTFDWSEFFESVSLVEQVLQRDPAGVYGRMDFRSRDRYRHAVEELAEPTGEGQLRVALKSVERARQVARADARRARRARRLPPDRRRAPAVRAQRRLAARPRRSASGGCSSRCATPGYLGTIAAGTALLVAGAVAYACAHGWRGASLVCVALLTVVPASELAIQIAAAAHQLPDSAAPAAAARARRACPRRRARW